MPDREYNKNIPVTFSRTETTTTPTATTRVVTPQTTLMNVSTFRRIWNNTPRYRAIKRDGGRLPLNGFSETRMSQTPIEASGTGGSRSGTTVIIREGNRKYDMGAAALPESFASLDAELTLKALNRAKASTFNAPIFLAEAGKTTDMVIGRLADLRGLVRDLRKGDVSSFLKKSRAYHERTRKVRRVPGLPARDLPSSRVGPYPTRIEEIRVERKFNDEFGRDAAVAAGNLWLEWKYGWQSIMMDVQGLAKTIETTRSKTVNLDGVIKTSVTRRSFTTGPYSIEQSPSCTGVREDTLMLQGRLITRYTMNNPNLLLPAKVGLTNPLSVAWELIPFSFVVDWFLPIGNYIDALDVNFLFNFHSSIRSNKAIFYRKVMVKKSDLFNYSVTGTGEKLVITKSRTAPSMALPFSSIQWKNGFANPERIFTSLALLGQSLLGFSHPEFGKSDYRPSKPLRPSGR